MKRLILTAAAVTAAIAAAASSHASTRAIQWEPYHYETRDGKPVTDAERGRITVPQSRSGGGSGEIELSFIRFRCTGDEPGPPIIWLAGGPGDFGSDDIEGPYLQLVRAFQKVADVIALDQRGTGLSRPLLTCPDNTVDLPLDQPLDLDRMIEAYRTVSRQCAEHWKAQGVDLSAYNTEESVADLEDLRRALGVEKVSLYGGSYGTHLGLAMIRRHPGSVARAVLSGVEGPDQTWKLPSVIETHFAEVARAQGEHHDGEDLLVVMHRVVERLDREPVAVEVATGDGDTVQVVVGGTDLRLANRYFLGDLDNIRNLPEIYAAMDGGDFSLLGSVARRFRSVSVGSAMYFCMDCASGATPGRMERIRAEGALPVSLAGVALNAPFPAVCDEWPYRDLGDGFRGPLVSDVPVLFVSGTLDGQTPVSNVSELLPGFRNALHLIVENATHQYLEFAHPGVVPAMAGYMEGVAPETLVLTAPSPFAPEEESASVTK